MVIAVNTRFLLNDHLQKDACFLREAFTRLTNNHPEHQFIFIFDRPVDSELVFASNITPVIAGPPVKHFLLRKFWYDVTIPRVLKKYKATVFISCDGVCSLRTQAPQCLVVPDWIFSDPPSFIKKSYLLFYKKKGATFLNKARRVVAVSEFFKKNIISRYNTEDDKIDVVPAAAKEIFHPLNSPEREAVKKKYTDGKEYFIHSGEDLMTMLKAFSIFKKRQQSNIKLVLAGKPGRDDESFRKSLASYKYRNDVVMTRHVKEEERMQLTGAAYALVYPALIESNSISLLEAMQSEVPVIACSHAAVQETAGDAALYADDNTYTGIAEKMMRLYKDEALRKECIEKGRQISKQYSWDKTAALLWESIIKAVQ